MTTATSTRRAAGTTARILIGVGLLLAVAAVLLDLLIPTLVLLASDVTQT